MDGYLLLTKSKCYKHSTCTFYTLITQSNFHYTVFYKIDSKNVSDICNVIFYIFFFIKS